MISDWPEWMGAITLARYVDCSERTVDNWVAQGILPPSRKRGGKLMWRRSEVDQYMANGKNEAPERIGSITDAVRKAIGAGQ